jgi:dihydrofolate reductase
VKNQECPDGQRRGDASRNNHCVEVARLKQEHPGDLAVSGPGLASALARLGLIDEYRLVISPVLVGGGKPYFPRLG